MNPIVFIFAYLFVNSLPRFQEMPWLLKCRPALHRSDFRAVGSEEIQLITGHSVYKTTVSYVSMSLMCCMNVRLKTAAGSICRTFQSACKLSKSDTEVCKQRWEKLKY